MMELLWMCVIGAAAGWLAGRIMRERDRGLWRNLIIGVLGAILGGLLFHLLGFGVNGLPAQLVSATAGAVLLLYLAPHIRRLIG